MSTVKRHGVLWPGLLPVILLISHQFAGKAEPGNIPASSTNSPDELTLEQLVNIQVESVFGASRYEQKVTQAPASVSIITSDEIKKFGHRSLANALRSVRGLYVTDDRNYSYLGIRGFARPGDYDSRILFLIDGHRMNESIFDSFSVGNDATLDVELIDRVEIIRGPGSSIYGNSAFLGVVNVVTRRGSQIDGAEASGEAGSFDTYKARFTYGKKFTNDLEMVLSGSFYDSVGQTSLYYPEFDQRLSAEPRATNNGWARNADNERAYSFFGNISYHDFTLSGAFCERNKKIPTASFGTAFNSGKEETTDVRGYLDLKYEHSFPNELHVLARAYYDYYGYYGTYPYANPEPPPGLILNKDYSRGDWTGTEVQLTKKFFDRHTLILGADYRENLRQFQENYDVNPPSLSFRSDRSSRNYGFYGQGEFAIWKPLLLNAGLRYDHFDTFGGTLNPRVGLIYNPWKKSTFKLLYGQAFRAPNEYELYFEQPGLFKRNPYLGPEKIRTYELVYEQYLPANHRLSISAYRYDIDGLISQNTDPASGYLFFDNLQRAQANGLELEFEGHYQNGILARASYCLQRTEDTDTGQELSNSPRHLAKLNVLFPLYRDKIFSGVELQYQAETKTLAGRDTRDFLIANWTIFSQKLIKNLEVSATIYNLFDTTYGYPGAGDHLQNVIQQDGRGFRVKLTYKF